MDDGLERDTDECIGNRPELQLYPCIVAEEHQQQWQQRQQQQRRCPLEICPRTFEAAAVFVLVRQDSDDDVGCRGFWDCRCPTCPTRFCCSSRRRSNRALLLAFRRLDRNAAGRSRDSAAAAAELELVSHCLHGIALDAGNKIAPLSQIIRAPGLDLLAESEFVFGMT